MHHSFYYFVQCKIHRENKEEGKVWGGSFYKIKLIIIGIKKSNMPPRGSKGARLKGVPPFLSRLKNRKHKKTRVSTFHLSQKV